MNKITQIKNNAVLEGLVISYLLQAYAVKNDDKKTFELAAKTNFVNYVRMKDISTDENVDELYEVIRSFATKYVKLTVEEQNKFDEWTEEYATVLNGISDPKTNVIKLRSMYTELLEMEDE